MQASRARSTYHRRSMVTTTDLKVIRAFTLRGVSRQSQTFWRPAESTALGKLSDARGCPYAVDERSWIVGGGPLIQQAVDVGRHAGVQRTELWRSHSVTGEVSQGRPVPRPLFSRLALDGATDDAAPGGWLVAIRLSGTPYICGRDGRAVLCLMWGVSRGTSAFVSRLNWGVLQVRRAARCAMGRNPDDQSHGCGG